MNHNPQLIDAARARRAGCIRGWPGPQGFKLQESHAVLLIHLFFPLALASYNGGGR